MTVELTSTEVSKTTAQTMSSREIAELTGKRHDHVLRDCEVLNETYEKISLPKIGESNYTNERGREYREYLLTKMQTFDLLTGYNTELRIKVNRRWEELEKAHQPKPLDFSDAEAVLQLAQNWAEEQRKRQMTERQLSEARTQIAEQAPKVLFAEAMLGSKTSCLIGQLAKVITQNGYIIGQNRLFGWLRDNGYLGRSGEHRNIPKQKYIEQGLFELKKGTRSGNEGVMHTTITTKVTPKGQAYFINKFLYERANEQESN